MRWERKGGPTPREGAIFQDKKIFIKIVLIADDSKLITLSSPCLPSSLPFFPPSFHQAPIHTALPEIFLDLGHSQAVDPQMMDHQRLMIPERSGCRFPHCSSKSPQGKSQFALLGCQGISDPVSGHGVTCGGPGLCFHPVSQKGGGRFRWQKAREIFPQQRNTEGILA